MRHRLTMVLCLIASLVATPVLAQQRVVSAADLRAAMTDKAAADAARRQQIATVLRDDEVRQLAAAMKLDVTKAEAALATLNGPDLERAAAAASALQVELSGEASTVTISITTLLLVIIIIILLAN